MPKEIFEVVRERFHLSDRTQYIVQGHWPKDAVMEAYLDQHKLKVSVKENENVSALERFKDPEKMQGIQITATVQIPENLEVQVSGSAEVFYLSDRISVSSGTWDQGRSHLPDP